MPLVPSRGSLCLVWVSKGILLQSIQFSRKRLSTRIRSRQLSPYFEPRFPVEASGACSIWTNCWIPWSVSTPSRVAVRLPEISISRDSYNQSYVRRFWGGRRGLCHPSRLSRPQRRVWHGRPSHSIRSTCARLRYQGSSHISRDAVNSCGTAESPWTLYQ